MFLFGTGLFSFVFVDFLLNVRSRKLVSRACPNFSLVSVLFLLVLVAVSGVWLNVQPFVGKAYSRSSISF